MLGLLRFKIDIDFNLSWHLKIFNSYNVCIILNVFLFLIYIATIFLLNFLYY